MNTLITWGRRAGISLIVVIGTLGIAGVAHAGNSAGSIEIHNRLCPLTYTGGDLFGDCHGNPLSNMDFTIDGPVTATQTGDANGNTIFTGLPAGTYEISGGAPGDFADTFVYCAAVDDPSDILVSTSERVVSLALPTDTEVVCDWYNIPLDLRAGGDASVVTTLPNTGAGPTSTSLYRLPIALLTVTILSLRAFYIWKRSR